MTIGRNDPCPCGSGRKYKRCCQRDDEGSHVGLSVLAGLGGERDGLSEEMRAVLPWEADVVPVTQAMARDPSARPVAVLVTSGGEPLAFDVMMHPPTEPAEIAQRLADAITGTAEQLGYPPPVVHVRHEAVATPLRERLAEVGIAVHRERDLPDIDRVGGMVRQNMMNLDFPVPAISLPHTWAAWGLSEVAIEEIFAAATVFYGAQPWMSLDDREALALELPGGVTWFACVLGAAASQPGLSLFEDLPDLVTLLTVEGATRTFRGVHSMFMSLTFNARSKLPAAMQREVARASWPVAGPTAYPLLCTLNTPGGGLTRARAAELAAVLSAVARCTPAGSARAGEEAWPQQWMDDATGIVVRHLGSPVPEHRSGDWT